MLKTTEHLKKARANEEFAASLEINSDIAREWAITILFYVAVHIVQAYFVSARQAYFTHTTRASAIQRNRPIRSIYDDYRELESLSREARYEAPRFTEADVHYASECLARIKSIVEPLLPIRTS